MGKWKICKQTMAAFLILAMFVCYAPQTYIAKAADNNLFPAGDFEDGLPEYTAASVNVTWNHDYYKSGCGSCKVQQLGPWSGVYFPMTLANNKKYRFSVWLRMDQASAGGSAVYFATRVNKTPPVKHWAEKTFYSKDGWVLMDGEFTLQEATLNSFEVLIYSGGQNTFYIDDLKVQNYPYPYENQFINGGFEDNTNIMFSCASSTYSFETSQSNVFEGTSALRVAQSANYGSISQKAYVQPGKKYFVSAQSMLLPDDGATSSLAFNMVLNGTDNVFAEGPQMVSGGGFVKTSGIFTVPSNTTVNSAKISVFAYPYSGNPVTFVLDNVELYEIDEFKISGSFPKNGGMYIAGKSIAINFSNNLNTETISNINNIKVNGSSDNIKEVKVTSLKSCTVTLKEALLVDTAYTVSLYNITDIYGQALSGAYSSFSFNTQQAQNSILSNDIKVIQNLGRESQLDITSSILTQGSAVGVVDYIYNDGPSRNLCLCTALYNYGKLTSIGTKTVNIGEKELLSNLITEPIDVPDTLGGSFTLKAFLFDSDSIEPLLTAKAVNDYTLKELIVKPDGTGDFRSPMLANASITDSGPKKLYNIIVYPGTYTDVEWTVKPYTTIKGTDRDACWLKGEVPASATNYQIDNTSTVWLINTAGLENLKITSKNMRYPVHSENEGYNKNAVHKIKNCWIENYGALEAVQYRQNWIAENPGVTPIPADKDPSKVWGGVSGEGSAAWGYGSGSGIVETFDNCVFVSKNQGWYAHNREDFEKPQINILNNTHISGGYTHKRLMQIESLGSGTDDQVIFNNCTFEGLYVTQDDYPWITQKPENQYADHADYKLTFNNCDPIGYQDAHRGMALAIFSNSTGSNSSVRVGGNASSVILGDTTAKDGGGGLRGYLYGHWDISGIKVSLYQNVDVANTLGRRLGNCTMENKTLNITLDGNITRTVVFNEDYTNKSNDEIINKINTAISGVGLAQAYNVTLNEYYPKMTDKELYLQNSTSTGIPRFAAVCYDKDNTTVRLMTQSDSASQFLGVALERIVPGGKGRILTQGILSNVQLSGFAGSISENSVVTITASGGFELGGSGAAVMQYKFPNWVYFKGVR